MSELEHEVWIVDQVDGRLTVLVEDTDDDEPTVIEVATTLLGDRAVEGAVLRVPLGSVGEPMWEAAERDHEEEAARRAEAEARLEALKKRDPGGDVIL